MTTQIKTNHRPVFITGHRNPDTDSICAAICYAELKNRISQDLHLACRAGQLNEETQFVLSYFGAEDPLLLEDVRARVRDLEIHRVEGSSPDESVKKVGEKMRDENISSICVTENELLTGLVTTGDIVRVFMEMEDPDILSGSHTPVKSITETLNGILIAGDEDGIIDHGRVVLAVSDSGETPRKGDIVISSAGTENVRKASELGAGCIIICSETDPGKYEPVIKDAGDIPVILTPYSPFAVANLINQSIPVSQIMKRDKLMTLCRDDFLADVREVMAGTRLKYFPVLDRKGRYVGMVSHRNLLGTFKRKLIMVDHNEKSQSVKGIEEAELLEIIDHHRLGSIESTGPIFCRNQPLGSTCTIIWLMYRENGIEINRQIAGLLMSAILSDTLLFHSPTCTEVDRQAAQELSKIAGVDCESFAKEMFRAGTKLDLRSPEEIIRLDFKRYTIEGRDIGIGQINSMSGEELDNVREKASPALESVRREDHLDMLFLMFTNIPEESSDVIYSGEKALQVMNSAFGLDTKESVISLPGIVSRKKQFLMRIVETIQR